MIPIRKKTSLRGSRPPPTVRSVVNPDQPGSGPRPRRTGPAPTRRGDDRRLPPLLRRAWFSLNQAFRRRIAHLGLTPDQYTALRTLAEAGRAGLNQQALTRLMSSDPNTITSLLERMEAAALVRRGADAADRRMRRVQLAPAGRRRFTQAQKLALALQAEVLGSLAAGEREHFLERLEVVAAACRAAAERPALTGRGLGANGVPRHRRPAVSR